MKVPWGNPGQETVACIWTDKVGKQRTTRGREKGVEEFSEQELRPSTGRYTNLGEGTVDRACPLATFILISRSR